MDMTLYANYVGGALSLEDTSILRDVLSIAEALLKDKPSRGVHLHQYPQRFELLWEDGFQPMAKEFPRSLSQNEGNRANDLAQDQ